MEIQNGVNHMNLNHATIIQLENIALALQLFLLLHAKNHVLLDIQFRGVMINIMQAKSLLLVARLLLSRPKS